MDEQLKALVEAMDRRTAAENRKADAMFAIAQALAPQQDEDDEPLDPPASGQGMGMA